MALGQSRDAGESNLQEDRWVFGLQIKLDIVPQIDGRYVVKRVGGEHKQHAHISTYKGCKILIDCIKKNKLPMSNYLKGSCKRLLTEEEYNRLRKPKDKYVNIQKGPR